ncbi:MAG: class I SAM-dependent methyltransferase [Bacteroidetes bacterium]|nr:class I SAM-dependent methyltransferase [Bacteroidota bacterium]
MNKIFYDIFDELPRQGPGDDEYTRKAYHTIPALDPDPIIVDIGCGTGMQTLELARISFGSVTGIDNHAPFINSLNEAIKSEGLDNCKAEVGDMNNLNLEDESCDLIWSEGAIYIAGFENGLREWKQYLKPGGYIVVSEIAWFEEHRPKELQEFWDIEVPDMLDEETQKSIINNCGFDLVDSFKLPYDAWLTNFYDPLEKRLVLMREKYSGNAEAQKLIEFTQREIDISRSFHDYYGYIFYIMMKR